jgi:hypothetical protein
MSIKGDEGREMKNRKTSSDGIVYDNMMGKGKHIVSFSCDIPTYM